MQTGSVASPQIHRGAEHSPAKAARAALAERPDLAESPFGQLVSQFAKDEPLPSAAGDPAGGKPA